MAEITQVKSPDDLAQWTHRRFAAKNTLTTDDAQMVEQAYLLKLKSLEELDYREVELGETLLDHNPQEIPTGLGSLTSQHELVRSLPKTTRARSKAHLRFVAAQPCLVCQSSPCDAHHVKFAEPRALGRKVSDEYTVPLCREHHRQLHRHGNERAWWANVNVSPLTVARSLWDVTQLGRGNAKLPPDSARDAATTDR